MFQTKSFFMMEVVDEDIPSEVGTFSHSQDMSYVPSSSQSSSQSSASSLPQDEKLSEFIEAPKALVFISCLRQLFTKCGEDNCNSAIDPDNVHIRRIGAVAVVNYECNSGHCGEWSSSPYIGQKKEKVGVMNLLLASSILTCGLQISQVLEFFSQIKIYMFSKTFYYDLKSGWLNKVVWLVWSECQKVEIQNSKGRRVNGTQTKLAGDGQFDSRGFSASYCTYVILDLNSSKVLAIWVAEKSMVSNSSDMEPYAAKTLLLSLAWDHDLIIDSITTDRSTSMRIMLEEIYKDLPSDHKKFSHYFDVWHWIRLVIKDLVDASKLVSCRGLADWIPSINSQMWHSFGECQGDPVLLEELLMSIPEHISNNHVFAENKVYTKCTHDSIIRAWLDPNSLVSYLTTQ